MLGGRKRRPLTSKEVKRIAKTLGFSYRNTEGAHEQWVREKPFAKMTIDSHLAPFGHTLIRYMARQAGVSVDEFYAALDK